MHSPLSLRLRRSLAILGLMAAGSARAASPGADPAPAALLFLLGDQHSAYAHTAQVVARIDALRSTQPTVPAAVLIDGDLFEAGNPVARRSAGEIDFAMVAALARRLPIVVNVGNHEAEFAGLAATIARLRANGATVVSNLVDATTGAAFAPTTVPLRLGTANLTLVGLATADLATYPTAVRPTLTAVEPLAWWRNHGTGLISASTVAVVLSHAGLAADRALLPLVPPGTLLVGAHNHLNFVHAEPARGVVYVHSGSWNNGLSVARLHRAADGSAGWTVIQEPIRDDDPADPALARLIAEVSARHLTPADRTVVGRTPGALSAPDAARFAVAAVRTATGAAAAFIGNTTFGAGLPAGAVSQTAFDAWIRFDGTLCTTEVDGRTLAALLAAANPGPDTPFAARQGEYLYADGPAVTAIVADCRYRIATNDWAARNSARYFDPPDLVWTPQPDLRLKATALGALAPADPE